MDLMESAKRVRIYLGEADKHKGRPMHVVLLEMLRKEGYAGATAIRGLAGFGHASRLHTASILRLSEDLPIVIDVVDHTERIEALLSKLESLHISGLVTVEDIEVHRYGTHTNHVE